MYPYLNRLPAYGRTYKSHKEIEADWNADKDFIDEGSDTYVNKQDVASLLIEGVTEVRVHAWTPAQVLLIHTISVGPTFNMEQCDA